MEKPLPCHVAIIMDGNGRWATARGLKRTEGHRQGAEAARAAVTHAGELGIQYLTLFGFSSENWGRPADEISELMSLLGYYLKKETAELCRRGARLRVIGDRSRLSDDIIQLIQNAEDLTKDNTAITVIVALSYGGRQDIVQAAHAFAQDAAKGAAPAGEEGFSRYLMTAGVPDPDLLIRTGGEYRISNFLLWQSAYAELYFTEALWPDFNKESLQKALDFFASRERRFGGLPSLQEGVA